MIYSQNILTPANTAIASLKRTVFNVTSGLAYKLDVYFPPGSAGLMGVAIFDGLFQVWPSTAGEFFVSDDETISFDDLYLKESAPYQFEVYTYNTDDTYDHIVGVRIGLVSNEAYKARFLPSRTYDQFAELIARLAAEKAAAAEAQLEQLAETPFEWLLRQQEVIE